MIVLNVAQVKTLSDAMAHEDIGTVTINMSDSGIIEVRSGFSTDVHKIAEHHWIVSHNGRLIDLNRGDE